MPFASHWQNSTVVPLNADVRPCRSRKTLRPQISSVQKPPGSVKLLKQLRERTCRIRAGAPRTLPDLLQPAIEPASSRKCLLQRAVPARLQSVHRLRNQGESIRRCRKCHAVIGAFAFQRDVVPVEELLQHALKVQWRRNAGVNDESALIDVSVFFQRSQLSQHTLGHTKRHNDQCRSRHPSQELALPLIVGALDTRCSNV